MPELLESPVIDALIDRLIGPDAAGLASFYEVGTITPVLTASGGLSVTYSNQSGQYVRIGKLVVFSASLTTTARSGGSGAISVSGLPYPGGSPVATINARGSNLPITSGKVLTPYVNNGGTDIALAMTEGGAANAWIQATAWPASGTTALVLAGAYITP